MTKEEEKRYTELNDTANEDDVLATEFIDNVAGKMEVVYEKNPSKKFFTGDTREFIQEFMTTFSQ